MSRTVEFAALGLLAALSALGYTLWQAEGLGLWTGMAFGFCL
ncbi:hypothetical protein [Aureimonas sp. AU22]|jgi:hypothetical protein|nr:hypothetical protein [Aureimonas sp. AU22]